MMICHSDVMKNWTKEEIDYLVDAWGRVCIKTIAKNLNKSVNAIKLKASRLELGDFILASDKISFNALFNAIYERSTDSYRKNSWLKNGFPMQKQKIIDKYVCMVDIDEFWSWAEKHKELVDFSRLGKEVLDAEPEWVDNKRKQDQLKKVNFTKEPWSKLDDEKLIFYLNQYKYSYQELSKLLHRTCGAIQRRVCDLGLKQRPVKANNHNPWSKEDFILLGEMIKNNLSYESMSEVIGRSSKAIRGRVFDHYLTEKLDLVRQMMGNDDFGDNLPERPIRYMRLMSDSEKQTSKELLSNMIYFIREHAKDKSGVSEQYRDYWQKDICVNWDDIKGCLKQCADCDSCSSFQKIQPQGCVRCGCTFYERNENKLCYDCRRARMRSFKRKYAALQRKNKSAV